MYEASTAYILPAKINQVFTVILILYIDIDISNSPFLDGEVPRRAAWGIASYGVFSWFQYLSVI